MSEKQESNVPDTPENKSEDKDQFTLWRALEKAGITGFLVASPLDAAPKLRSSLQRKSDEKETHQLETIELEGDLTIERLHKNISQYLKSIEDLQFFIDDLIGRPHSVLRVGEIINTTHQYSERKTDTSVNSSSEIPKSGLIHIPEENLSEVDVSTSKRQYDKR